MRVPRCTSSRCLLLQQQLLGEVPLQRPSCSALRASTRGSFACARVRQPLRQLGRRRCRDDARLARPRRTAPPSMAAPQCHVPSIPVQHLTPVSLVRLPRRRRVRLKQLNHRVSPQIQAAAGSTTVLAEGSALWRRRPTRARACGARHWRHASRNWSARCDSLVALRSCEHGRVCVCVGGGGGHQ